MKRQNLRFDKQYNYLGRKKTWPSSRPAAALVGQVTSHGEKSSHCTSAGAGYIWPRMQAPELKSLPFPFLSGSFSVCPIKVKVSSLTATSQRREKRTSVRWGFLTPQGVSSWKPSFNAQFSQERKHNYKILKKADVTRVRISADWIHKHETLWRGTSLPTFKNS